MSPSASPLLPVQPPSVPPPSVKTHPLASLLAILRVRPGEEARALAMFAYLFSAVGAFIIGRISRDTLFLELPNAKQLLPYMYIGIAIGVSVTVALYGRLQRLVGSERVTGVSLFLFAAITLGCRWLISQGPSYYWFYYIWVDIFGAVTVIQCWTLASEIFDSREAKRLFAFIGGGGVLANIVCGALVKQLAPKIGSANLVYPVVALLLMSLLLQSWLRTMVGAVRPSVPADRAVSHTSGRAPAKRESATSWLSSRHLQLTAIIVIVTFFVSTLVDYQFKLLTADAIPNSAARAAFFGTFFGVTGMLSAVVQFGLTSRLLERFGVLVALILLPIAMLGGSLGLLIVPGLIAATWAKGSENVLRYTINDATMQLLYVPIEPGLRARAKATIDGVLKPCAIGGSGLFLMVLASRHFEVSQLSWFTLVALCIWLGLLFGLRREYVQTLMRTMNRRRLDLGGLHLDVTDESTQKAFLATLSSTDNGQVLHGLELLTSSGMSTPAVQEAVMGVLERPFVPTQLAALRYLANHGSFVHARRLLTAAETDEITVRAQVIQTLARLGKQRATPLIEPFLHDSALKVRAATVASLITHGGIDGVLRSADVLKAMLADTEAVVRAESAWVLGEIGVPTFYQPLIELFADATPSVRLAAIAAAGKMKSPELLPHLIQALEQPATAASARDALILYGDVASEQLLELVVNQNIDAEVRRHIPEILSRRPSPALIAGLIDLLPTSKGSLRTALVKSLLVCAQQLGAHAIPNRTVIAELVRVEISDYYRWLLIRANLELDDRDLLMRDALSTRLEQSLLRGFRLLELLYPAERLELVYNNLHTGTKQARANAVEILDNVLENEHKRWLIPIAEDAPESQQLKVAATQFHLNPKSPKAWFEELLRHGHHQGANQDANAKPENDPWLVAVCLETLRRRPGLVTPQQLAATAKHNNPLIRETAMWVLATV